MIHATDSVGAPKVVSVAQALRAQNPSVAVQPHDLRLTDVNADDLIDGYDLVIDGADNFATRYLVNDACVRLGKPLVWGSVLGFAAQVSVFWDAAPEGRGLQLRDVFPEPPAPGTVPSCAEAGVVGAVCAQAGSRFIGGAFACAALAERERHLLGSVVAHIEQRFLRARQAAAPGWAARFQQDMQQALLAELDLRLQPAQGLLAALADATGQELAA